jgi:serine/threonine-protein kinase
MPTAQSDDAAREDTPTAGAETSESPVETIGEFHLIRRLGKGGMAEVWLAEQSSLKRHVALKLLRRDMTEDPTYVKRFQTEAKASAGLNHPNVVQVYTVGQEDGQHYIAQEYVQGQTLRNLLQKKGPLSATAALHIIRQVAAGLQAAAERGIVHRDIKPENIMITRKGEVKVADFGLAQQTHGDQLHLTQEGVTMGTPLYMSPEQVKGRKLDHRSDVYSLGVTCYHMLAGRPPFEGATAVTVAVQHLNDEPEPLASIRSDLPPQLCEMVERMMAKNPADRYPDAKTVLLDARRLLKAIKESGAEGEVSIEKLSSPSIEAAGRLSRRTIIWRSIACVLLGGAAAGLGWWLRTPNLLATVKPTELKVLPEATAEEQYIKAMFRGDEQGFLAVQEFYNDDFWHARAAEQLALMYLQDPNRAVEAEEQLDSLISYSINGPDSYAWEAQVGKAVLAANDATTELQWRNNVKLPAQINESAGEPWKKLYRELSEQVDAALNEPDSDSERSRPQPSEPSETPEGGDS